MDGNDAYVAMGRYGLVRAQFTSLTTVAVSPGPYFGTGSYYTQIHGGYDNFEFRQVDPTDSTLYVVSRQDPPQFADVVVQDDGTNHRLWAAVDHLGVVAFDLAGTWSTSMPIIHQEGKWVASSGQRDTHIQLVEDPDTDVESHYAHRLAIVQASDGETSGLVLAVGVHSRPLILSDSIYDEGRTIGHLGNGYQGTGAGHTSSPFQMTMEEQMDEEEESYEASSAVYVYTVLYDLRSTALTLKTPAIPTQAFQHARFLRQGGRHLYLPPVQPQGELLVLGGHLHTSPGTLPSRTFLAMYQYPFQGNPDVQPVPANGESFLVRGVADRPGWHSYDMSSGRPSKIGSTDGPLAAGGIMAHCGASWVQFYSGPGGDNRGTMGILYNPRSIRAAPLENQEDREFIMGAGRPITPTGPLKPHWMLVHFDPGEDLCAATPTRPPDRKKRMFVQAPKDRFTQPGRGFYNICDGASPGYDGHVGSGNRLTIVGRSASPAGLWVLSFSELEDVILNDPQIDDGDVINEVDTANAYHRELLSHPEFEHVYYYEDTTDPNNTQIKNFLLNHKLNGWVLTFAPEYMEIPAPQGSGVSTHWVAAVPCAAVHLPNLDTFTSGHPTPHPEWAPDEVYDEDHFFDHAMVRVFDVDDYDTVTLPTNPVDAYTLLGPRPQCAAVRLQTLNRTIDSVERSFVFVTNFTDSVMAWEITDLLDREDLVVDPDDTDYRDCFLEEWITPLSVSDDLPNNAWHLGLVNEIWVDSQQTSRNEIYVYVQVGRYGMAILNFQPDASPGQRLVQVGDLRTPTGAGGFSIGEDGDGNLTLYIVENHGGLRTYVHED